ncbi:UxaA family hydrolase [Sporomusa acidovorans]|uniref:Altronate dehydratase n=1 Tax=Sporomusa acidovorans (strain ATCC 49682 / DSM 3132 / Mol) TaxID=1123286 RepID=A0ABZ3IWS4_SPOA4|nr:altronate dehydratase family protein [Sporomusa acidovorans]OZC23404.1 altronate dehydratase [Sporomusa acidovorans DSM 3132]SDE44511.1 altronate dehydratase large subunit [Sporomusa acidovorans]
MNAIHVSELDNVATALELLKKGDIALGVAVLQDIRQGHKFATADIKKGEPVIKYASHIGLASCDIKAGEWVHVHNMEGERGRGDTDSGVRDIRQDVYCKTTVAQSDKTYKLMGYRRSDGGFGFRNHILVIPSVHCANKVAESIANAVTYSDEAKNDETNVVYVIHQHGCSELSYDVRQTQDVIVGTGANPNVYGVLVVGLGCEGVQARAVAEEIRERAPYKAVEYFTIQEAGGTVRSIEKGVQIVKKMLAAALKVQKSEGSLADIVLGTECGGSDSFSGLSANPSLGAAADMIIQHGGSVILAETTELIGAEHILASRAINASVKDAILSTIKGYEDTVIKSHADIRGANPSPGNIEGGLSSIEEKSLGCIYKAGNQPVVAVKEYAKRITGKGLTFMNTPGNDIEQLSGMVAGGCNICVFTTGRGTPTGSAVTPTIKLASNSAVFQSMNDSIDLNAGTVIEGTKHIQEVGEEILDFIVAVSNGKLTKAEMNRQNDFSIWRLATTV